MTMLVVAVILKMINKKNKKKIYYKLKCNQLKKNTYLHFTEY